MLSLTSKGKETLDGVISSLASEGKLPAFVAGATTADGEIYFNASGKKVINDEASGNVDPDSVFWICSMTKMITHIAALQLIERGKLDPETPVADILPQMKDPVLVEDNISDPPKVVGPAKNMLRVKHLLNFTGGTYNIQRATGGTAVPDAVAAEYTMEDKHTAFFNILKGGLPGVPLLFEPGTNFAYAYSSDILGFVVEKVSGQKLDAFMQENIFKPLKVKASFYLTGDLKERLVPITYRWDHDRRLEPFVDQPDTRIITRDPSKVTCIGGWGLYTSLRDYLSILRHLLQILEGKAANPIITLETAKSLFVPTLSDEGVKSLDNFMSQKKAPLGTSWSNAIGVNTSDWEGRRKAGSGFWGGWLGTEFWIDPATGIAGVFGVQLLCLTAGACDADFLQAFEAFEEILYSSLQ